MVSTRSMRSRAADENGKESGEAVDSYTGKQDKIGSLPPKVPHASKSRRKNAQKVLAESNSATELREDEETSIPQIQTTRQRWQTHLQEAEEAPAVTADDLKNAASLPLPEEESKGGQPTAAQPPPKPKAVKRPHALRAKKQPSSAWKWLLLAAAVAAAVTAVGVAMQQRDAWQGPLVARIQGLEAQAKAGARAVEEYVRGPLLQKGLAWKDGLGKVALEQRGKAAELALRVQYGARTLWRRLHKTTGEEQQGPGCAGRLDARVLDGVLSGGAAHDGLRASLHDVWQGHKDDPHKGSGVLLVGESNAATAGAAATLQKALPSSCRDCLLAYKAGLPGQGGADAPGAAQKLLAGFLQKCPQGVVVLEDVHKLHPQLLPVFINALSEQGAFEVDGRAVPAWGALYVATMQNADLALGQEGEEAFRKEAKKSLTEQLLAHPAAASHPGYRAHAEAFRRRLEHVAAVAA